MKVVWLVGVLTLALACDFVISTLPKSEELDQAKRLIQEAINEATQEYNAEMQKAAINGAQSRRHTREAKKSTKLTQEIGRISRIYTNAYKKISARKALPDDLARSLLQEQLPMACQFPVLTCDENEKYRTADGTCNNIKNPYWGAIRRESLRLLTPAYEDGKDVPRGGKDGTSLPSPRKVSLAVHIGDGQSFEHNVTHMAAQFGQFLDHDITLTPGNSPVCCGSNEPDSECWTLKVDPMDPHYKNHNVTCLEFIRSTPACPFPENSTRTHQEQFNAITAYIDGSVVYGSDNDLMQTLRAGKDGKLVENSKYPGFLPWKSDVTTENKDEVIAGDIRANEMPGLTVMQSLFLREHNRIAGELSELSKKWDDEKIFQETRRIIAAELQQITYGEFLPAMLGQGAMKHYNLELPVDHKAYTTYQAGTDASIFNNFATAAYRFGHTLVNGLIQLYQENKIVGSYNVKENYLVSTQIIENSHQNNEVSGYDLILNGLIRQNSQAYDGEIHEDMTNHLFKNKDFIGSDLAARNIQRGRDHGLPNYNEFRKNCSLSSLPDTFTDTNNPSDISVASWKKLKDAGYQSPRDIDLYTGGLSETPVPGALSGPTFVCLQGIQFQRLLYGDRFFFTHKDVSGSFTPEQLAALRGRTLGDIICQNSALKEAARNVFYNASDLNPMIPCDNAARKLDISLFAELDSKSGVAINPVSFGLLLSAFVLLPLVGQHF